MSARWVRLQRLWGRMYELRELRRARVGWQLEVELPFEHDLAIARALSARMDAVTDAGIAEAVRG